MCIICGRDHVSFRAHVLGSDQPCIHSNPMSEIPIPKDQFEHISFGDFMMALYPEMFFLNHLLLRESFMLPQDGGIRRGVIMVITPRKKYTTTVPADSQSELNHPLVPAYLDAGEKRRALNSMPECVKEAGMNYQFDRFAKIPHDVIAKMEPNDRTAVLYNLAHAMAVLPGNWAAAMGLGNFTSSDMAQLNSGLIAELTNVAGRLWAKGNHIMEFANAAIMIAQANLQETEVCKMLRFVHRACHIVENAVGFPPLIDDDEQFGTTAATAAPTAVCTPAGPSEPKPVAASNLTCLAEITVPQTVVVKEEPILLDPVPSAAVSNTTPSNTTPYNYTPSLTPTKANAATPTRPPTNPYIHTPGGPSAVTMPAPVRGVNDGFQGVTHFMTADGIAIENEHFPSASCRCHWCIQAALIRKAYGVNTIQGCGQK